MKKDLAIGIAKNIEDEIPTESQLTYVIPAISKKNSKKGKSEIARGKLWSAWRNHGYAAKKIGKKIEAATKLNNESDLVHDNTGDFFILICIVSASFTSSLFFRNLLLNSIHCVQLSKIFFF